jgi:hypothetical protein
VVILSSYRLRGNDKKSYYTQFTEWFKDKTGEIR